MISFLGSGAYRSVRYCGQEDMNDEEVDEAVWRCFEASLLVLVGNRQEPCTRLGHRAAGRFHALNVVDAPGGATGPPTILYLVAA